jgi:integrase
MVNEIFQEELKELFLSQFEKPDTQEVYRRIFKQSSYMENKLKKDVLDFTAEELEEFIKYYLSPKTKESARTYCNVLSSYIQWGMDNHKTNRDYNPLRRHQDYFYQFVQEESILYISKSQKDAIIYRLVNFQDKFMVQALFEGIAGQQLKELVNLKRTDIDEEESKIKLINGEKIKVDKYTIELAIDANKETIYYKKNGEFDYSETLSDFIELPESEYVLKGALKKNTLAKGKKISHHTVYNRLEMIKSLKKFEQYKEALTTKNLVRSGMIYYALQLYKRDGVIDTPQIKEVCERFRVNYKWALRDFLNVDMLKKLYPNEFKQQ